MMKPRFAVNRVLSLIALLSLGCGTRDETVRIASVSEYQRLKLESNHQDVESTLGALGFKKDPYKFGWREGKYFGVFDFVGPIFEDPDRLVEYSADIESSDSEFVSNLIPKLWGEIEDQDGKHDSTVEILFKSATGAYRYWSKDSFVTRIGYARSNTGKYNVHLTEFIDGDRDLPLIKLSDNSEIVKYWRKD